MVDGVWAAAPPLHAARATAATRAKTPTVVSKRRRNMQDLLWTNGTNGRTPERGILSGDGVSRAGCQAAPGVTREQPQQHPQADVVADGSRVIVMSSLGCRCLLLMRSERRKPPTARRQLIDRALAPCPSQDSGRLPRLHRARPSTALDERVVNRREATTPRLERTSH